MILTRVFKCVIFIYYTRSFGMCSDNVLFMEEEMKKGMAWADFIGAVLTTDRGVQFKILEAEDFPEDKISKPYKGIMKFPYGKLVAVNFRGTHIPNITYNGGVVRLTKVLVNGKVYDRAGAISEQYARVAIFPIGDPRERL